MAPLRVLVVEDDPQTLGYVCALLAGWGYAVDPARSATAALDAMDRECPDVVLSDLLMPGMDGLELLRSIRAIKNCAISFILITGHGSVSVAVGAIMEGADDVLVKPLDELALFGLLQRYEATRKRAV
jgi:DNA-binding response OmpR family regulator